MQLSIHEAQILSVRYNSAGRSEWVTIKVKHMDGELEIVLFGKEAQAITDSLNNLFAVKERANAESRD